MIQRAGQQLKERMEHFKWWANQNALVFLISLSVAAVLMAIVIQTIRFDGLGFDKDLWEWMNLLLVPAALALGGLYLSRAQKRREFWLVEERQRQETLDTYFDRLSELILDRGLGSDSPQEVRGWRERAHWQYCAS